MGITHRCFFVLAPRYVLYHFYIILCLYILQVVNIHIVLPLISIITQTFKKNEHDTRNCQSLSFIM